MQVTPPERVSDTEVAAVALAFGQELLDVTHIGQMGGFGGCYIVRAQTATGARCLRRWPADVPPERVAFLQGALAHAAGRSFALFPRNEPAAAGERLIVRDGHVWEYTTWAAGAPHTDGHLSPARLDAAARTLARMHAALEGFDPRGITFARDLPAEFAVLVKLYESLRPAINRANADGVAASHLLDEIPIAVQRVAVALDRYPAVFTDTSGVAHGDIDPEHLFFTGDQVTGIIDFDETAFRPQSSDLAMLLERCTSWDAAAERAAVAAYRAERALTEDEAAAMPALATLAILGWAWEALHRRYVERADFSMFREGFPDRMRYYTKRLAALRTRGAGSGNETRPHSRH